MSLMYLDLSGVKLSYGQDMIIIVRYTHRFFICIIKLEHFVRHFSLSSMRVILSREHNILLHSTVIYSSRTSSIFPSMTVKSIFKRETK